MNSKRSTTTLRLFTMISLAVFSWGPAPRVSGQTKLQGLGATSSFTAENPIRPDTRLEITLSRSLKPSEKIAVILGSIDVSDLFEIEETRYTYKAELLPLPLGQTDVKVYLISADGSWDEIVRLPLSVETAPVTADTADRSISKEPVENTTRPITEEPAQPTTAGGAPQNAEGTPQDPAVVSAPSDTVANPEGSPQAEAPKTEESKSETAASEATAVKERAFKFLPSFTLALPAQPFQGNFPIETRPSRRATSIDLDLTGTIKFEAKAGMVGLESNFDIAGSSFKEKTLQFGTLGQDAPDVDLSSYLINLQVGKAKFSLGHTSFGANRHLISGFSSRGLSLSIPINKRFDITAGVLNGTSVLGVSNFLGMSNVRHQMQGVTLGIELFPKRAGAMRLEVSGFNGYLQGISNVSEGSIVDAEQSRGLGLRFVTSDSSGRFKLEFGFARSRFFNPEDKTLDPDGNAVPIAPVTRDAHYAEAAYQVLKDIKLGKTRTLNLSVGFRYEFVEPLYRSLGASASADRFSNDITVDASVGEITFQIGHANAKDNLRGVPSILRSLTRSNRFTTAVPLAALFGIGEKRAKFFPRLGYSIDQTHNFGEGIPVGGGFEIDPATIPDLMNINQNFSAGWQFSKFNVDYTYSRSFADNRQATSAGNDQLGWVHTTTFSMNPLTSVSFNFGFSFDSQHSFELGTVNQTKSANFGATWKPFKNATFAVEASQALAGDLARTSRNRNINYSCQFTYSLAREGSQFKKYGMQIFARFADAYIRTRDFTGPSNQLTRTKILTAGMTLNIF